MDLSEAVADSRYGDLIREHLLAEADYMQGGLTALILHFLARELSSDSAKCKPRIHLHILCYRS